MKIPLLMPFLFYYSPKVPLYDLLGHEDKVLCSDWSLAKYMISGGADNTLRIFKSKAFRDKA